MTSILGIVASSKLKVSSSFESIATLTPVSSTATLDFTSIPSTYKHLQIRFKFQDNGQAGNVPYMLFNNSTSAIYTRHTLNTNGSTVNAFSETSTTQSQFSFSTGANADYATVGIVDIHDYASTTKNKTVRYIAGLDRNTNSGSFLQLQSNLFATTTAISSIQIKSFAGLWNIGTSVALYGIKG